MNEMYPRINIKQKLLTTRFARTENETFYAIPLEAYEQFDICQYPTTDDYTT